MSRPHIPPGLVLVAITAFTALAVVLTLWGASVTPWLGASMISAGEQVRFEQGFQKWRAGAVLEAIAVPGQPPVPLVATDVQAEPDGMPTYSAMSDFYDRQGMLAVLMKQPELEVHLRDANGVSVVTTVAPAPRPLWSLPISFWVQISTGASSVLIAGWAWALRPRQLAPALFAISGLGVMLTTLSSAYYAHRGLALPAEAYAWLVPVNHLGIFCFGGGLVALFLVYPRRLVDPRWLWLTPAVLGPYLIADSLRIVFEAKLYYNVALSLIVAMLVAIMVQWWATRHHPDERAVLGWFGLSVALGMGIFAFLASVPGLLGINYPLVQHAAAGSLVLIYAGLALGLRRYRLFELGEWAYRVLFFAVGSFLLLALDAALIAGLNIDTIPALGVSLMLVALLYLPLRDWVWRRLFVRQRIEQHEVFSAAMDVAFARGPADSATRWHALLARLFDPLETAATTEADGAPAVSEDGIVMLLPPVAGAPGLRLSYPFGGRGLFQPVHLALATQLVALTVRAAESREAYMRGVGEERRRMARDLHDDVGARLLTGLHTADGATRPTLQAALSDIRAIVSGLAGEEASLDRVLAETRHEAARRLEAAEIALDWPLPETEVEAIQLDYRLHKALTSAVREIVSNVIRHSGAGRFTVAATLSPGHLALRFADDGRGLPSEALAGETTGFGLRNLRHRIEDIGGHLRFDASPSGTAVTLDIPLILTPRTPEPGVPQPAVPLNSPA